jgi:hypothetical protein
MLTEGEVVRWIILAAFGAVGWFMKRTINEQQERITALEKDQQRIREDYLHKNDFKDFKVELRSWFDEIKTDIRGLRQPHV